MTSSNNEGSPSSLQIAPFGVSKTGNAVVAFVFASQGRVAFGFCLYNNTELNGVLSCPSQRQKDLKDAARRGQTGM